MKIVYTASELAKLTWRVFFKRRPFPTLLISSGLALLFSGNSLKWFANWETLKPILERYSSEETASNIIILSDFFFPQDNTPQSIMLILGVIAFCTGIISGLINFYFEKVAIKKSTLLPIEIYGFSRAVPSKELYKELESEGYNTSIRYRVNLSPQLDKPFVSADDVKQSVKIIKQLLYSIDLHRADNSQLNINITSIAQVPAIFQLGYSFGMMAGVNVWSWDRFKQRWDNGGKTFDMIRTLELNTGNTVFCPKVIHKVIENKKVNSNEVGFSFSFTNNVDLDLSINASEIGKLFDLHFEGDNKHPNNLLSKSRRMEVLNKFNEIFEREVKNSSCKKLHLFISAPTSFVFELGQMLSQNHYLPCAVYQYGDVRSVGHPYHSYSLSFSGVNAPDIKILKVQP
ncbi:SAVED domain-containing protein [Psychromonas antarctica]|uniref:SAVED domain-containing protein n=1 Tax=Psychromonas antarctica TaxID=67573 RepID=UPI001EE81BBA|nr:SAVED domain-containing protein [Psychromonas antarctica]MCG6202788.1 SAVED domain-containing protein [Psychromonas antarctica]